MHYARRLVNVRYGADSERRERVLSRLEAAFESVSTSRLMRSPLQITIMTALVDRRGKPPESRWNLFDSYYDVIYQREAEKEIPASWLLRQYEPDINAIHRQVGLLLQIDAEQSGSTEAKFSKQRFISLVKERLKEEGHESEELIDITEEIVEAALQRLVFLVGVESDQVGFEIRSLQEFMAAECLMDGSDDEIRVRLEEIAPNPNWRNVFLFAAGKCFAERQYLRATIHEICSTLNEKVGDEIAGTYLVGSSLAMDLLEDGLTRHQPKYAHSLTRIALRALDVPNHSFHIKLSGVYEPQLEQVYIDEITRRLNDIREEVQIGAWTCLVLLISSKVQWAGKLGEEYWPSDSVLQAKVLERCARFTEDKWVSGKILELMPNVSVGTFQSLLRFSNTVSYSKSQDVTAEQQAMLRAVEIGTRNNASEVSVLQNKVSFYSIVPVFDKKSSWFLDLRSLTECDSSWIVFGEAAKFIGAPSKDSLAEALRNIAALRVPNLMQAGSWTSNLPWPILACLNLCKDESEILMMADRASSGDLGDSADWMAAENRWFNEGISDQDILSMSDERQPFDREIGTSGYPSAIITWGPIWYGAGEASLFSDLLDLYGRTPCGKTRSFLAYLAFMNSLDLSWMHGTNSNKRRGPLSLSELKEILSDLPPSTFIPIDLVLSHIEDSSVLEIVDLFAALEEQDVNFYSLRFPRGHSTEVIERLLNAYCTALANAGLLSVVGMLAEEGILVGKTLSVPGAESFNAIKQKVDSFIITLAQHSWESDATESLIASVQEYGESSVGLHLRIINTLQLNRPSGKYFDDFLMEFWKLLYERNHHAQMRFMDLLGDLLSRRTSKFSNREECQRFNLPAGIINLLRS